MSGLQGTVACELCTRGDEGHRRSNQPLWQVWSEEYLMLHTFTHTRSPFLLYSHVAIAFNGGKDVTVVMHLLGAYVAKHPVSVA